MGTDLVPVPRDQRRCALYRHYDRYKILLYVGITESLEDRTGGHARSSDWVRYASHATVEWFDTRGEAATEERKAIESELPIFNRQYAAGDVEARILDYTDWRLSQEPEELLSSFECAVHAFLACLPDEVREAAERAATERHERRGWPRGGEYEADVLSEVAQLMFALDDGIEQPF